LLVITAGPPQSLSIVDVSGNATELAPVAGVGMFAPNSSGDRVAYIDSQPGTGLGELRVLDIAGGEPTVVDPRQVVGFAWDPAGLQLLYFTIDVEAGELVPNVWDGSDVVRYPGFVPSSTFVSEYLPFWDQYSRSLSLWSPDSDAFVVPDASDRILVQHLDEEVPSEVGSGVFATWGG
jgi:TolB protein